MIQALYSVSEVAKILHISRIAVFKKIKSGELRAQKVGRNYVIEARAVHEALGQEIGAQRKQDIDKVVEKALCQYREAFQRLGAE